MQANANLHEVVSDKAAQFVNYVVCDLQKRERARDGFSSGRPRCFFFITAPLPAWLTAAAADIATLLLPSFVSFSSWLDILGVVSMNKTYCTTCFYFFSTSVSRPRRTQSFTPQACNCLRWCSLRMCVGPHYKCWVLPEQYNLKSNLVIAKWNIYFSVTGMNYFLLIWKWVQNKNVRKSNGT